MRVTVEEFLEQIRVFERVFGNFGELSLSEIFNAEGVDRYIADRSILFRLDLDVTPTGAHIAILNSVFIFAKNAHSVGAIIVLPKFVVQAESICNGTNCGRFSGPSSADQAVEVIAKMNRFLVKKASGDRHAGDARD